MNWLKKLFGAKEPKDPSKKEEAPLAEMDDTTFLANKYVDKSDPSPIGGDLTESDQDDSPLDFDFDLG
jgi:hypothetical protein